MVSKAEKSFGFSEKEKKIRNVEDGKHPDFGSSNAFKTIWDQKVFALSLRILTTAMNLMWGHGCLKGGLDMGYSTLCPNKWMPGAKTRFSTSGKSSAGNTRAVRLCFLQIKKAKKGGCHIWVLPSSEPRFRSAEVRLLSVPKVVPLDELNPCYFVGGLFYARGASEGPAERELQERKEAVFPTQHDSGPKFLPIPQPSLWTAYTWESGGCLSWLNCALL